MLNTSPSEENQVWRDALNHMARHPRVKLPVEIGTLALLAGLIVDAATGLPGLPYSFAVAGPMGAIALVTGLSIMWHTNQYINGRTERPHFITPTERQREFEARAARPDGITALTSADRKYICHGCWKPCSRILELKRTHPSGRTDFRTFGMHEDCENTADGQAVIAAEKLMSKNDTGRFTPPEMLAETMDRARRNFHQRHQE